MKAKRSAKGSGFTLIELLVVIAIIGALMAMLVPAVQKVRESAARTSCQNNLKQIGLALHNYHDARRSFPPAKTSKPKASWTPTILPYLEQDALYKKYDFTADWTKVGNQAVVSTPLSVFQCPSTPDNPRFDSKFKSKPACGDYNAITDISLKLGALGVFVPSGDRRSVMVSNKSSRLTDITDGTSNTVMVAEDAGRPVTWNAGVRLDVYLGGGAWASPQGPFGLNGSSQDGSIHNGYCAINCTNDNEIYSFHGAGAHAVFADGSVQFLKRNIAINIMAALVTRAGGETIPTDFR